MTTGQGFPCFAGVQNFQSYQVSVVRKALLTITPPDDSRSIDAINDKDVRITFIGYKENKRKWWEIISPYTGNGYKIDLDSSLFSPYIKNVTCVSLA
jgi:hypothetical protein